MSGGLCGRLKSCCWLRSGSRLRLSNRWVVSLSLSLRLSWSLGGGTTRDEKERKTLVTSSNTEGRDVWVNGRGSGTGALP